MNPDVAPEFLAKSFPTTSASAAVPAGEVKIDGTAIPRFHVCHAVSDRHDVAGEFMSHYSRCRATKAA